MRIHRFYVGTDIALRHNFWLHDERLIHQWYRVLRFRPGQQVVLFDGVRSDRLYAITALTEREAHLEYRTDYVRSLPPKETYLLWALLKKDKNDWVLQKATELGVRHFVPILADRSEKTGFNVERAQKIVIEAAEQCGRSDIPLVREPMRLQTAVQELRDTPIFICEQGSEGQDVHALSQVAVAVGPEGGWSDEEKQFFAEGAIPHIGLGAFTLRAETAAVVAAARILQN